MAWKLGMLGCALIFSSNIGEASMNGQTIEGEILDPRVTNCGVRIEGDSLTAIRPFIDTSEELRGQISILVFSRSGSNTNVSQQVVGFPGNNIIQVSRPSAMRIEMSATADGKEVCRLNRDIDLDEPGIRL